MWKSVENCYTYSNTNVLRDLCEKVKKRNKKYNKIFNFIKIIKIFEKKNIEIMTKKLSKCTGVSKMMKNIKNEKIKNEELKNQGFEGIKYLL